MHPNNAPFSTLCYYLWIPLLASSVSQELSAEAAPHNTIMLPSVSQSDFLSPPEDPTLNFSPVIGIVSHPGDGASGRLKNGSHVSYIAASYVKFVESAGARVIPLIYTEPLDVLFNKVLEKNDAGEFFPCYAICLGFELLTMIVSKVFSRVPAKVEHRLSCTGKP